MARPYEKLPPGAKSHLEAMASNGLLSESAAATALGMPLSELRKVLKSHKPSAEIWENALSIERDRLLEAQYAKALDGDIKAGQYLLATRHGMSEKNSESTPADRVNIVFQLPGAMTPEQYSKLVQQQPPALTDEKE